MYRPKNFLTNSVSEGIATCSDENKQYRSQVNTELFRSSLHLAHENEDTPVVRSDGNNTMLWFCY